MSEPTVCAIMLTRDRPAMVTRAVQSFMAQTYQNRYLLIWDTGDPKYAPPFVYDPLGVEVWHRKAGSTIGQLRNEAITESRCDIVMTMDSDDVSHPNRMAEQVGLLEASGSDVAGYNESLFWDEKNAAAWLYRCPSPTYGLGASLTFWRSTWERKPFADINHGEDMRFITGLKVVGVSANWQPVNYFDNCAMVGSAAGISFAATDEPRMICSIHGQNTSVYAPEKDRNMWKRAADWDAYCAKTMEMK